MDKAQNFMGEGKTAQKKRLLGGGTPHLLSLLKGNNWGGDTAHTLLIRGTIGVGTPHILC